MKIIKIRMIYDWKDIDAENDNIDVFVEADDGYNYTLSLATVKNIQFLMNKEEMDYYGPGYPFIIVNKLTPEIIEQAVEAFAEADGGYWLKVYHFGGSSGMINGSIFDQLKTKHLKEQKKFGKLNKFDLIREAKRTLEDSGNKTYLIHLVEQYRSGNKHLGIKTRAVPGTCLIELRAKYGYRFYFQEKNDIIKIVAISNRDNQRIVIDKLKLAYPEKKIF